MNRAKPRMMRVIHGGNERQTKADNEAQARRTNQHNAKEIT
jgi:hypothetical protein